MQFLLEGKKKNTTIVSFMERFWRNVLNTNSKLHHWYILKYLFKSSIIQKEFWVMSIYQWMTTVNIIKHL